jgi:hypothetical protein
LYIYVKISMQRRASIRNCLVRISDDVDVPTPKIVEFEDREDEENQRERQRSFRRGLVHYKGEGVYNAVALLRPQVFKLRIEPETTYATRRRMQLQWKRTKEWDRARTSKCCDDDFELDSDEDDQAYYDFTYHKKQDTYIMERAHRVIIFPSRRPRESTDEAPSPSLPLTQPLFTTDSQDAMNDKITTTKYEIDAMERLLQAEAADVDASVANLNELLARFDIQVRTANAKLVEMKLALNQ